MNELETILKSLGITKYKLREDGGIVVLQDVHWEGMGLEKIPVQFYSIDGDFNLKGNKLETLENFPYFVTGIVTLSYNKLKSFDGIPEGEIMLGLIADNNFLTTLKGAPPRVDTFSIDNNNSLESIIYAPSSKHSFVRGLANVPVSEIAVYNRCISEGAWDSTKSIKENFKSLIRKNPSCLQDEVWRLKILGILEDSKDDLKGTLVGVKYGL